MKSQFTNCKNIPWKTDGGGSDAPAGGVIRAGQAGAEKASGVNSTG